ncbi:hypothetical protein [Seonamhaeicola sp.]|uniref:HD domain-containing protein n=1 Tax=Seonamhaeicola sp. TaxID=1912245 RepID=UPI00261F7A5D|nr:hypothetical protein [Seonamhaeicola sp.]
MTEELKNEWSQLVSKYSAQQTIADELWHEIKAQYTKKNRYYHNLSHINTLLVQAKKLKETIVNYDNLLFAIWYHDIIYNSKKQDNEEKSAVFAKKRLKSLEIDEKMAHLIQKLILSTKNHQIILGENDDNAYFLDMDMSILGAEWPTYLKYLKSIRKEYAIFPNFMYKKGRKKALNHFLDRKTIFFTKPFQAKFESQARENINREIDLL